jgi:hypothetical protein
MRRKVNSNGSLASSTGRNSFTVSRRQVGVYDIVFGATYPNSNYIIMVTALGAFVSPVLGGGTETTTTKTYSLYI